MQSITVQSYQSLMEKLEVDISLVEKEKARIAEILEDYLKDVHENLGKIDHNSTITVRERPIKMLRLELPSWEENLTVYQLRINDFLNEITRQGIEWFERNENAQEYFGTQLTTKHLYDTVAGIGMYRFISSRSRSRGSIPSPGPMWPETREGRAFCPPLSSFPACSAICGGMIQISSQTEMKERFSSWIIHLPRPTRSIF